MTRAELKDLEITAPETMLMHINSGSLDTADNWICEILDEKDASFLAIVIKSKNGDWVEA